MTRASARAAPRALPWVTRCSRCFRRRTRILGQVRFLVCTTWLSPHRTRPPASGRWSKQASAPSPHRAAGWRSIGRQPAACSFVYGPLSALRPADRTTRPASTTSASPVSIIRRRSPPFFAARSGARSRASGPIWRCRSQWKASPPTATASFITPALPSLSAGCASPSSPPVTASWSSCSISIPGRVATSYMVARAMRDRTRVPSHASSRRVARRRAAPCGV